MPVRVSIGLGSNLGDRARHIADAVTELAQLGEPVAVSSLYESAPIGGPDQGPYINAVVVIETDHGVREVLDVCMAIEKRHGRERRERWGPRTLDLDILLYGDRSIDEPGLTVPHPHLGERRFVLAPLLEAEPEATLPDGTTGRFATRRGVRPGGGKDRSPWWATRRCSRGLLSHRHRCSGPVVAFGQAAVVDSRTGASLYPGTGTRRD